MQPSTQRPDGVNACVLFKQQLLHALTNRHLLHLLTNDEAAMAWHEWMA